MKFTAVLLSLCLCGAGTLLAVDKPAPEKAPAAAGSPEDAEFRTATETAAAIEALGARPAVKRISSIVFRAVRSSPGAVLPIVHAAVRASPQDAAPAIVTAATAGVPNPWKKITYRRLTALDFKKGAPDFKGGPDGKQISDGKSAKEPTPTAVEGPAVTLAEAIARTAADAQPGLSLPAMQAAVDIALLADPATLLRYIESPRTNTGVGDAGFSNYANEPLRPSVSGSSPVPVPVPPAVSQ